MEMLAFLTSKCTGMAKMARKDVGKKRECQGNQPTLMCRCNMLPTCHQHFQLSILEHVHQVLGQMLRTAELDTADSITPDDVDVFLDNGEWAIRSTYHMVLNAPPGAAIFQCNMLFNIPFAADWHKTGEQRQSLTDHGN
jgi:hypothetical protein